MVNLKTKPHVAAMLRREAEPFNVLTSEEFGLVLENSTFELCPKSKIIYREGDAANDIKLLCTGKVKVFKEGIGGREQIVKLAKQGEFVGYRAAFAEENHSSSAVTLEDCYVCSIPKQTVVDIMYTNVRLCQFIVKSLALELGFSRFRSVTLSQKQIRGRLAESLLVLRDKYGYNDDNSINVCLSREDLAKLSNMTTANAIRTLSNFVSENIISVQGRTISILNEPALERISKLG